RPTKNTQMTPTPGAQGTASRVPVRGVVRHSTRKETLSSQPSWRDATDILPRQTEKSWETRKEESGLTPGWGVSAARVVPEFFFLLILRSRVDNPFQGWPSQGALTAQGFRPQAGERSPSRMKGRR